MPLNPNVVRGATGQAAVKQGLMGRALSNVSNVLMMGIPLVGLASKPFSFLYQKTGASWLGKLSRGMQLDRQLHVTSISDLAGKGGDMLGVHAPGLASGISSVGTKVESAIAGKVETGAIASGFEKVSNALGGKWLFGKYQALNKSAALNHHESLLGGLAELDQHFGNAGLAGNSEAHAIQSQLSSLKNRLGSIESIDHAAHGELKALFDRAGELRKALPGKESAAANVLHSKLGTLTNEAGNVINKMTKANYEGIGAYVSNLPKRLSNLSLSQVGVVAMNVGIATSAVSDTVKTGRDDMKELRAAYRGMTGKVATDKELLFGKDVPEEIKTMRVSMRGTAGNGLANLASLGVAQTMFMRGGKGAMLGMVAQMAGNAVAGYLMPKSTSLAASADITKAREAGTNVPAQAYVELLANVSKTTASAGLYGPQKMRADYLALYAESKQMTAGEALGLANKAGSDPAVKAQITAEVENMLAQKKAAAANDTSAALAAQPTTGDTLGTAADINPMAKTGHVKALEAQRSNGRAMQSSLA